MKKPGLVWRWAAVAGIAVFAVCGLFGPLEVTRYDVSCKILPAAFDGYRILQVSDLQNSTDGNLLTYAQELAPDLIVLTGDNFYTTTSRQTLQWTLDLVQRFEKIAPVYAVSGNHDLWNRDFILHQHMLEKAGAVLLENASAAICRGGEKVRICGITDPYTLDGLRSAACTQAYMQQVQSTDGFDILLFHRADLLDLFRNKGYELIFAGHLHGGQVRLPGGISFVKYAGGVYRIDDTTTAVVSRGLGNVCFPRFYDPPELVLVTLHRG